MEKFYQYLAMNPTITGDRQFVCHEDPTAPRSLPSRSWNGGARTELSSVSRSCGGLDNVMLQDVLQKSSEACQEARDCELLDRQIWSRQTPGVRFGYRRIYMLLRREGWDVGKDRFYRVYCEENLGLRRKRPWRHVSAVHR